MNLVVCGINYKTASLSVREKFAYSSDSLAFLLKEFLKETQADEVMILSTCNRTEFYCINAQAQSTLTWLRQSKRLSKASLEAHWYVYQREEAVRHILRVASGLDSIILGEPQIVGQLKAAFSFAQALGTANSQFKRLFQYVFTVTKQIRYKTEITAHPVSLAFALVRSAKCIFAKLADTRVLLIGAGETILLVAKHLRSQGIQHFLIANRTLEHAEKLASFIGGKKIHLNEISKYLPVIDLVVTATTSPLPIVDEKMLSSVLRKRRRRPLFMADLGMPRDIEPGVNKFEDVYLYTLDDLQRLIQKNQLHRQSAATKAEGLIEQKLQEYHELFRLQKAGPIISAYRQQAEEWRDQELKKAFDLLDKGFSHEEVMQRLAYKLTNKLLHLPSKMLRKAALLNQKEMLYTVTDFSDLN